MVSVTKRQADWTRYYEQLDSSERIDAMLDELRRLATVPTNQLPLPERSVPVAPSPSEGEGRGGAYRSLSP